MSDLREIKSTPSASNEWYEFDVQNWCWFQLMDFGRWNSNPKCHCLDDWVQDFSFRFKEYAKKSWKGSFLNLKSANKVWFDTPIEFPEQIECMCANDTDEENEVTLMNLILNVFFFIAL